MNEKEKILIADDSAMNRAILAEMLGDGYEILEAENGRQAVAILQSATDIDLLLLDIMMPDMDGFEVLEAIRNNPATEELPVIMLTSLSEFEHHAHATMKGANGYLTKPLVTNQLIEALDAILKTS